jgi:hypothetical protein
MSAASGMCGSSSGLAVARFACDRQTCGDPAPARTGSLHAQMWSASGIRGFAGLPSGSWEGVPPALRAGRQPRSLHTPQPSTLTQLKPLNA